MRFILAWELAARLNFLLARWLWVGGKSGRDGVGQGRK